jgi:hypothetical protein
VRKLYSSVVTAFAAITLFAGSASAQTFIGSWTVDQGPYSFEIPTAYSARQAAALLFGGIPTDYLISTVDNNALNINNSGWYSTFGVGASIQNHDYVMSTGGLYRDTGDASAYVSDWAKGPQYTNYAFSAVPEPSTVALLGVGMFAVLGLARRRGRGNTLV